MLYTVTLNLLSNLKGASGITLENHDLSLDMAYIALNTQHYPLNITKVRLAIEYGINRTAQIQSILHSNGVLWQGPVMRGELDYNDSITPTEQNLTKAAQLLTEAGFPGGKGIPPLTLMYYTGDPVVLSGVQSVQSDLSKIGVKLTLQGLTPAE